MVELVKKDGEIVDQVIWGGYPRVMGQPAWLTGAIQLGPIFFPTYRLFMIAVAATK